MKLTLRVYKCWKQGLCQILFYKPIWFWNYESCYFIIWVVKTYTLYKWVYETYFARMQVF